MTDKKFSIVIKKSLRCKRIQIDQRNKEMNVTRVKTINEITLIKNSQIEMLDKKSSISETKSYDESFKRVSNG